MNDKRKTQAQLMAELEQLRRRVAELEAGAAEHARAEDALRDSEERFAAFMDNLPAVVLVMNEEHRVVYGNAYVYATHGDWLGKTAFDLFPEEEATVMHADDDRALVEGYHSREESSIDASGVCRTFQTIRFPVRRGDKPPYIGVLSIDITARKQTEDDLRASEEKYRSVFETVRDALFVLDQATGAILDVNPAACELYGYTRAELLTMRSVDVSAEPDRTAAALKTHLAKALLRFHRKKDGTVFPVELTASYYTHGDRRLSAVSGRDITDRIRAEEELYLTQVSVDRASQSITWIASDGTLVYLNEAACQFLGQPRDELTGRKIWEVDRAYTRGSWPAYWRELEAQRATTSELSVTAADGTITRLEVAANFVEFGGKAYDITYARDITERKRVEDELRESEEKYRAFFEAELDAILLLDHAAGRIVDANRSAARLYGYTHEELLQLRGIDLSAEPEETLRSIRQADRHVPLRYHCRKDGTILPVEITSNTFMLQGRTMLLCVIRDITDRQRAEDALKQRNRDLALVNRATQALASSLDLNVVLTMILEEMRRMLDVVASSVWLVDPLTNELVCRQATGPNADVVRGWRMSMGRGLVGWCAQHDQSMIVADSRADDRYFTGVEEKAGLALRSILSVPLRAHQQVIGVVQVVDAAPNRFDASALRLSELLASAAAIAIDNARLFEETRWRVERLATLNEISTAISQPLDIKPILDTAVNGMARILNVPQIGLALFDDAHEHLTVVAETTMPAGISALGVEIPLASNESMARILATKAPLAIDEAQDDPLLASVRRVMIERGVRSILIVPLIVRGDVIGTISADAIGSLRHFTPEEIELAMTVANLLAVRIEQARLFRAEHDQRVLAEALRDTAAALNSTLDFDEVLDRVLNSVGQVMPHDAANIMLLDPARDLAYIIRCRDVVDPRRAEMMVLARFVVSRTPKLWAMLTTRHAQIISDVSAAADRVPMPGTEWIRATIGVPICIKDEVLGFLNVDSAQPGVFTPAHSEPLQALANQAAVAIQNARLHEQVQQHAADLELRVAERTAELQRERNRLQTVFDSAGESIQIMNAEHAIEYCNPATERMTGYVAAEIIRQNARQWQFDYTSPVIADSLRGALARGEAWQGEVIARRKDGARYDVALTINPLTDARGRVVGHVAVQRDITRLKELDRLKDQFVSRIGHELRTPLSSLIIYLDLLDHGKPEKRTQYIETLHREADRLRRLVEGFLEIAELDANTAPIELTQVNLNQLAMAVIAKQSALADQRGLTLDLQLDPALPPVTADAELVKEVIARLLDNALNYTPRAGTAAIITAMQPQTDHTWVTLTVKDTGPGLLPDELPRLFDRFYRGAATRSYTIPGVGLSLPICQSIVGKLGGRLTVESEPGQGAAFTVWLK